MSSSLKTEANPRAAAWNAFSPSPSGGERSSPYSPYNKFSRDEWGKLRADTPLTLTEHDLVQLRGQNEQVALDEVADIYLPLTRLLNLYVAKAQS